MTRGPQQTQTSSPGEPVARLSIDKSGIGMNLAENLARDYPQVVPEAFSNEAKERWATDFKILLQRRDIALPRERELVRQITITDAELTALLEGSDLSARRHMRGGPCGPSSRPGITAGSG